MKNKNKVTQHEIRETESQSYVYPLDTEVMVTTQTTMSDCLPAYKCKRDSTIYDGLLKDVFDKTILDTPAGQNKMLFTHQPNHIFLLVKLWLPDY